MKPESNQDTGLYFWQHNERAHQIVRLMMALWHEMRGAK